MEGKPRAEQRAEVKRAQVRLLASVATSQGWPEYRRLVEQAAETLERTVLSDRSVSEDIRVIEFAKGKAAGLREAIDTVEREGRRLLRLDAQAKAAQAASQEQEQDHGASAW